MESPSFNHELSSRTEDDYSPGYVLRSLKDYNGKYYPLRFKGRPEEDLYDEILLSLKNARGEDEKRTASEVYERDLHLLYAYEQAGGIVYEEYADTVEAIRKGRLLTRSLREWASAIEPENELPTFIQTDLQLANRFNRERHNFGLPEIETLLRFRYYANAPSELEPDISTSCANAPSELEPNPNTSCFLNASGLRVPSPGTVGSQQQPASTLQDSSTPSLPTFSPDPKQTGQGRADPFLANASPHPSRFSLVISQVVSLSREAFQRS